MRYQYFAFLLVLFLAACSTLIIPDVGSIESGNEPSPVSATPVVPTSVPFTSTAVTALPPTPSPAASPPPAESTLVQVAPTLSRLDSAGRPPLRDDIRLAAAYQDAGVQATPEAPFVDLEIGATNNFYVGNIDDNTINSLSAELLSVGEYAYFWFDTGEGGVQPDAQRLAEATEAFDEIFETLYEYFGRDEIDGGRAHIVHASPLALCTAAENCRLAGYFSPRDLLPRSVNPTSNERPMFVMNAWQFETIAYLDTLAHELRHMLGVDYDAGKEDWFVEGAAMLAEDLVGFSGSPQARGNIFLANTDQQLNSWTEGNTIPHYGQGYLLSRFIYDRLGKDLYRDYTFYPAGGLAAVDEIAKANGFDLTGKELWQDWLVAMALLEEGVRWDDSQIAERYRWQGPELAPVVATPINTLPATIATTVNQYAADYYLLPSSGQISIEFAGSESVSLLDTVPPSGEHFWYAQRANYSNPRLTRALDLRDVSQATLNYQAYIDIEAGYDFAYVSVSTDDGNRWIPLAADGMQGLDPADDPSGSAFAERFYTGRLRRWVRETVDLTPFAGQEVLLRFEYVTDPILTYGGLAVDDIQVPEIDFFDDVESFADGWDAEGFVRTTAELEQRWHLQLVSFDPDGRPAVDIIPVGGDGKVEYEYQGFPGVRRPMLIVAANAPETLQPAAYTLRLSTQ
jgi:immune inhibitor A